MDDVNPLMPEIPLLLITSQEVCELADITRSGLGRIMKCDPDFPKPYRFKPCIVLHYEPMVLTWLEGYRKWQHKPKPEADLSEAPGN